MVTIATFDFVTDAEIVRGRLLAEGIHSDLVDQHLVQTDWLYSIAVGGIKLQVAEPDVARALAVLAHDYSAELE